MGQCSSVIAYKAQSVEYRSDLDNAMNAMREDGLNLEHAAGLRGNIRVVKEAVKQNPKAFEFASDGLRRDPCLAMELLELTDGKIYRHILLDDPTIDLKAAMLRGGNLEFMSEESRANYEIVKAAVLSYGAALQYASLTLRDDPDIVRLCIKLDDNGFPFASERLRGDPEFVDYALRLGRYNIEYVAPHALDAIGEARIADIMSRFGYAYRYLPLHLRASKRIAVEAVTDFYDSYSFVPEELKGDDDVVQAVLNKTTSMFKYLPYRFKTKEESIRCILAGECCSSAKAHRQFTKLCGVTAARPGGPACSWRASSPSTQPSAAGPGS